MTTPRRRDGTELFAITATALAAVALVVVGALALRPSAPSAALGSGGDAVDDDGSGSTDDGAVADPGADPTAIVAESAEAMAAVSSVEFTLERTRAPIFIDEFESIALDRLRGQFTVPSQAQAELTVTVNGNFTTKLGAVAVADEVWISNPVTGDFETLPSGYDIDPSKFFDPQDGWRPLLAELRDVELVGVDDRGGDRYHVRGTAPAAQVQGITVGLVRGQDLPVDLWIHPGSHLVTHAEFTTVIDGAESDWVLGLDRYGDSFTIVPPENVRT